jgi:hypothetical protein
LVAGNCWLLYLLGMADVLDEILSGDSDTVSPTPKQFTAPAQRENFTVKDPLDTVLGVTTVSEGPERTDTKPRRNRSLTQLMRLSAERGHEPLPIPTSDAIPLPSAYRNKAGEFVPGNPGGPGRPASFGGWAKLARLLSGDGLEIMAFAFGVLRGEITHWQFHPKTGELVEMEASPALKWEIAKWIKEQGFGKEVDRLDVTSGGEKLGNAEPEETPDLSQLTTAEVRQYLALRMKAMKAMKRGAVMDAPRVEQQHLDTEPVKAEPVKADSAKAYSVIADGPRLLKDVVSSLRGEGSGDA